MTASFAAYASQFLNREQQQSSMSSSQPLFFSFTTDNESSHGNAHQLDLDDLDDPHFRTSAPSKWSSRRGGNLEEDDDPYLRLDEEDQISRNNSHSMRLLDSHHGSEPESSKGWLAHQASPLRNYRSSSPSSSSERSESSSESGIPPPDILTNHAALPPSRYVRRPSLPPPPMTSLSLTESLLPRDGTTRPLDVFSLPDPRHISRRRRKYNDSAWTVIWCTGLTLCLFFSILTLFVTHQPSNPYRVNLPYTTLLHTVPMLTILIILSAVVSYAHIFLLRIFVKPVMVATSVFIPATLFISAIWAFIGSFMWDVDTVPTWGETVGLRLFSLVPLVLSLLTARRLLDLPRDIHTTSSLLTLTTQLLQNNPFLLGLSPAVLLASLIASIPFLTLAFRLLLVGYSINPSGNPSGSEWHVRGWANWAIVGTVAMWLWSWGVARGILRVTCAGVVGAWYFADPSLIGPAPTSTHTIHAALTRATSPSLGTIILSALIITAIRLLGFVTILLRRLSSYLPLSTRPYLQPLVIVLGYAAGYVENATKSLSTYALIYTGLTGDAFFPSARRARALTSAVNISVAKYRKRFKTEPPLTMLTYAPLTLTFPFSLTTYLFVAHTLGVPDQALLASVLSGGVTALVGLFCVGLVKDAADTLYICYCIDQDAGQRRRNEVFSAFEYETRRSQAPVTQPQRPAAQQPVAPQSTRVAPPQPTLNTPVRQHRLQSPISVDHARVPTPDPFEQSPIDEVEEDLEAARPNVSTNLMRGYHVDGESTITRSSDKSDKASERSGDEGGIESQLFPGSDIF